MQLTKEQDEDIEVCCVGTYYKVMVSTNGE